MTKLYALLAAATLLFLTACATVQKTDPVTGVTTTTIDVSKGKLAVATHADLLGAAAVATKNGYPARAAFWTAADTLLTAQEAQASACANAIAAMRASAIAGGLNPATPITNLEIAAETVGNFSGIPASVKINCEPLPIPPLPILPGIPKL